jgi:O-antigen/teichoic acid export membrane protein
MNLLSLLPGAEVLKSAGTYAFGDLTRKGLSLLLGLIAATQLGLTRYGTLALLQAFVSLVLVFFPLGMHGGLAPFYHKLEKSQFQRLLNAAFSLVLLVTVVGSVGLTLFAFTGLSQALLGEKGGEPFPVILVALISTFSVFAILQESIYVQKQWYKRNSILIFLTSVSDFLFSVLALRTFHTVEAMHATSAVVKALVFLWLWKGERLWEWDFASLAELKPVLRLSIPLVPHLFAQWVTTLSDRLILARFTSAAVVGLYSLAYNLAMSMLVVVGILGTVFGQLYLKNHASGVRPFRWELFKPYFVLLTCSIPILVPVIWGVVEVMGFESHKLIREVALIIVAAYYLFGLYAFLSNELVARHNTVALALVTGSCAVVNVALTIALVANYGAMGAAIATLVTYGVMSSTIFTIVWILLRTDNETVPTVTKFSETVNLP